jgi:hypothetical protein
MAESQDIHTTTIVTMPAQLHAQREMAREVEAMRRSGKQLDRARRKGGFFIGADGVPHDAHGKPIPADELAAFAAEDARAAAAAAPSAEPTDPAADPDASDDADKPDAPAKKKGKATS